MNQRVSTEILSRTLPTPRTGAARSLRRLLVAGVCAASFLVLALVASAGIVVIKKSIANDENLRLVNAAALSRQLVERVLAERARQADLIATAPTVAAAARRGGEASLAKGLTKQSIDALEAQFKATR